MKANSQSAIVSISSESTSKRWDLFRGRNGGKESWVGISAGAHTPGREIMMAVTGNSMTS